MEREFKVKISDKGNRQRLYKDFCPDCGKEKWVGNAYIGKKCIECWRQIRRDGFLTIEQFWNRVNKTETCWIWKKGVNMYGYGKATYKNKTVAAHRLAWFFTYGCWPEKDLLHRCDNPPCVRIDHLFEGTDKDNAQDAFKKGRRVSPTPRKENIDGRAWCYRHQTYLPIELFDRNRLRWNGLSNCCKQCKRESELEYKIRKIFLKLIQFVLLYSQIETL